MSATPSDVSPNIEKRPLYEGSTQFKHWRFSPEKLAETRSTLNAGAVAAIKRTLEADEPGSSSIVSFLEPSEELTLVKLYISKVVQLCGLFRFPEEVEATAITYIKRFYLKNTVMDWHPKNVMLTALFLATKTTNNPISLETYAKHIPKTSTSDVVDLEFLVAQSLGFEFAVWHAHRALWGICLDVQTLPDCPTDTQSIYESAVVHIRASRLTDLELVYSPSQIALAAFSLAAPELAAQWSTSKLDPTNHKALSSNSLSGILDEIKTIIVDEGRPPDVESVREVDRRLRLCKNPAKVVGSQAYLAKKAEDERQAEEKRQRKVEAVKAATAGDPFGNDLASRPGLVDYDDDDDDD